MAKNGKILKIGNVGFEEKTKNLTGVEECATYSSDFIKTQKRKTKPLRDIENDLPSKRKKVNKVCKVKNPRVKSETLLKNAFSPSTCGSTVEKLEEDNHIESEYNNEQVWTSYSLPKPLIQALQGLGFNEPTQIQALTLPAAILGRRDILGAAETGSGKTLAFGLPILAGILKIKEKIANGEDELQDASDSGGFGYISEISEINEENGSTITTEINLRDIMKPLYALILTPTRELALQVKNHLGAAAKYTGINIALVVGGMAAVKQERILLKGPEIVVATPGRLWELIQQGNLHLSQIDNIRFLAIDETDRMLEKGHFQELHDLLERINFDDVKRQRRQNFVFSATLTLVHEIPNYLKTKVKLNKAKNAQNMTSVQKLQKIVDVLRITDPKVVDVTAETGTPESLSECRIMCDIEEKDYYVYYFLKRHLGRTLIFCNSIGCVKRLSTLLSLLECHPLPLHASMQQRQRLKNLERFRDTKNSILIATDVAARGLDIPNIEHVLHYQTPRTAESYIHRSGRTARASQQGITVLLIEPNELKKYLQICRTMGKIKDLPAFSIDEKYLNVIKLRVNLARDVDRLQLHIRKTNSTTGWMQKAAEEMDIIIDNFNDDDNAEINKHKKIADIKRKQLTSLLAKPIMVETFSGRHDLISGNLKGIFTGETLEKRAIDVVQDAVEEQKKVRRLYKPKKRFEEKRNVTSGALKNYGKFKAVPKKVRRKKKLRK